MNKFQHTVMLQFSGSVCTLISKIFFLAAVLSTSLPVSAQLTWQPTNGPEGGGSSLLVSNDQFAFYPDQYSFYRTQDGLNWERIPMGHIWPMATANSKVAGLQGYFLGNRPELDTFRFIVSNDNGSTWQEGDLPPTTYDGAFSGIAMIGDTIYVTDSYAGLIFETDDDGLTWDTMAAPGQYCSELWAFDGLLYALWNDKIWVLNSPGFTWKQVSPVFDPWEYPANLYVRDSIIIITTEDNIRSSKDNGLTWIKSPIQYSGVNCNLIQVGNRIYAAAGATGLVFTENGGQSWVTVPLLDDYTIIQLGKVGEHLLTSSYNKGVFRFEESSNQLIPANNGLFSGAVYDIESDSAYLWVACGNNAFKYDVSDKTWEQMTLPLPDNYYELIASNGNGKVAVNEWLYDRLYVSLDGGATWKLQHPFLAAGSSGNDISDVYWLGDHLFAITIDGNPSAMSVDGGQSWVQAAPVLDPVEFNGKYYGRVAYTSNLKSTNDLGLSWQDVSHPFSFIHKIYATEDKFFMWVRENSGDHLYYSNDGDSWNYASDGLPADFDFNFSGLEKETGHIWNKNGRYFLYEKLFGFYTSPDTCKTWLPLCYYGEINNIDSIFYRGETMGGVVQTGLPENLGLSISGIVFKDDNNNGVKDSGEIPLQGVKLSIKGNKIWPYCSTLTKQNGEYFIGTLTGNPDTLRVTVNSPYSAQLNPPFYILGSPGNTYNFGVHFSEAVTDVSVTGNFISRSRPGFQSTVSILLENEGTLPVTGSFGLKLNQHFEFNAAIPQPDVIIGADSLVWNFAQTGLFEKTEIKIIGTIPATAPIGDVVKLSGYATTSDPDNDSVNNRIIISDTIVGSFDPNEKLVKPAPGLTAAEIASGKDLNYTILFQNTGTFQADRVRITDMLDTALNLETLKFVAASHPVTQFNLLPGGLLEIEFDNIALPDSNSNEPASHGFVTFAIQRKKQYRPNFKITNKAAIFFDFNNPIITNTVETKLYTPTVNVDEPHSITQQPLLLISPNPASAFCQVNSDELMSGPAEILVTDMSGKVCIRQFASDINKGVTLSVANLSNGSYTIKAASQSGSLSGKLQVAHKK